MEHWLYVTLLLILVHDSGDGFAHSGSNENTCYWQRATELVTKQLPEDKMPYLYVVQHGRHRMSYSLKRYATSLQLSFNYWVTQGNVSIVVRDEHYHLQSVELKKWSSYVETFNSLTSSTQILIIVHLDDEGVFALTELQMKISNDEENATELSCTNNNECDLWRYQGFQWNIYHPYFVVGNDTKVEGFTDSIGRHQVFSLSSRKQTEQELFIRYYLNGAANKKAELILLYKSEEIHQPIELWKDEELQPVWKTLSVSTETYIRPNYNYTIIIEANTDGDTMIALSSLYCRQKETVPSINYVHKVQSSLDFFNTGWIIESDSKWRHNDSYDEWYLYLSNEDRQAVFRSWWIVPRKQNFLRLNYRKIGEGETKIAIYSKNENNQKRILKRLNVDNTQWKSVTISFSIASDFYISIKGIVNEEETQLHLTQLSVNDPCHPDPCQEGKCIVNNETNFECQCNFGFIGTRCELTDWCSLYNENITGYDFCIERNASCLNVMESDTFTCVCDNKLQYFSIDNSCTDVDMCGVKKCQPNAICEDNKCKCRDHYEPKTIENKSICEAINYCERGVCGEAKCTPGNDDRPGDKCYCDPGFVYRNKKCKNNLCNFPAFNQCEQQCSVIDDHYQCSCYNGFDLVNNSTCDITEGWSLCHNMQCDNGTCVMNLSTNITSCACNVGYVYSEGKCTDYCSFNNGTLPKNICPSGKCVADSKHVYKCLCEGEYEISEDGITCISRNWCRENEEGYLSCWKKNATCILKDNSYRCVCPPGTEEDENKICTNILHIRKYVDECLSQNARLDLDAENKATCICPPFTSFVEGKCSFSPLTYSGILAVTKKFLVKDSIAYLRNIIDKSMIQIFKKSGANVDYRASAILDCLEEKTDIVCKIILFFNEEADKKVNLIRNNAICIDDTEYCIIPPRLILNKRKVKTIFFNRTDFCRDTFRYYCPEQTYCQNNVMPETGFTCKCQPGYQPYNIYYPDNSMAVMVEQCKDIDECHPKNPCPKNSNCINSMGSYECRCSYEYRPKYRKEHHKLECIPVCDPNPCEHGECMKMPEGFKCRCDAGFTGILCDEEDINFKHMCNKLIITGSVLGGALLITLVVAYAFRMRAKKKLESRTTQIIQMRGITNEGFAD